MDSQYESQKAYNAVRNDLLCPLLRENHQTSCQYFLCCIRPPHLLLANLTPPIPQHPTGLLLLMHPPPLLLRAFYDVKQPRTLPHVMSANPIQRPGCSRSEQRGIPAGDMDRVGD